MGPIFDPTKPLHLLSACPPYKASPLNQHKLRSSTLWVKDETNRMSLGSFKALGGVYAVAKLIEAHLDETIPPVDFVSDKFKRRSANLIFVCASAGNHGMAVAAGSQIFGAACRVHISATVPESFAERLRYKGAHVVRSGETYEQSVEAAISDANTTGAIHLADGSWSGYTEPPRLVMEGYTVIAEELRKQFEGSGDWPSHVYLQAGVGGFAAAISFMIRENWNIQPRIIIVEPELAPCLKHSISAGELVTVDGPISNMGRLDCKTPSMIALEILSKTADRFVTISDDESQMGVNVAQQLGYRTTTSGGAGLSALLLEDTPPPSSLIFLTEGA